MKIRTGFVSNSSSSSFVCCISGVITSGRDGSYEGFSPVECICGHGFQPRYALEIPDNLTIQQKEEIIRSEGFESITGEYEVDWDNLDKEDIEKIYSASEKSIKSYLSSSYHEYGIFDAPICICPICAFQKISRNDRIKFLVKEFIGDDGNLDKVDQEIKQRFSNYDEFWEHIKGIKL